MLRVHNICRHFLCSEADLLLAMVRRRVSHLFRLADAVRRAEAAECFHTTLTLCTQCGEFCRYTLLYLVEEH
jgi:hypothetical protein